MSQRNKKIKLYCIWVILILCFFTTACINVNGRQEGAGVPVDGAGEEKLKGSVSTENDIQQETGIITWYSDLTHDGIDEKLVVDTSLVEESQEAVLKVYDSKDNVIWQESAYLAHAGWNSVYLYTIGEKDYLLRYNPYMIQGHGNYKYQLFSLDERGTEKIMEEGEISFCITGEAGEFDIDKMVSFYNEINEYLGKSILLLSTEKGVLEYSTETRKITRNEEFSWLYQNNNEYNENDSLEDKLKKYKENMK